MFWNGRRLLTAPYSSASQRCDSNANEQRHLTKESELLCSCVSLGKIAVRGVIKELDCCRLELLFSCRQKTDKWYEDWLRWRRERILLEGRIFSDILNSSPMIFARKGSFCPVYSHLNILHDSPYSFGTRAWLVFDPETFNVLWKGLHKQGSYGFVSAASDAVVVAEVWQGTRNVEDQTESPRESGVVE